MNTEQNTNTAENGGSELNVQLCDSANYVKMTVLDISDDEDLRFAQRVLESESTLQDRDKAHKIITAIRTRIRKTHA
jgi:hypothetical protein